MYITEVVGQEPKAKKLAKAMEEAINNKLKEDPKAEFVSFAVTPSAKAILVFKVEDKPVAEAKKPVEANKPKAKPAVKTPVKKAVAPAIKTEVKAAPKAEDKRVVAAAKPEEKKVEPSAPVTK